MDNNTKVLIFRKRFHGRQDVYGYQWVSQKGKGFSPKCGNRTNKELCHIIKKDNVPCSKCEHQDYSPVTNESVLKHINGEEAQNFYLIHLNSCVHFAAFDFDMKPGKEEFGRDFSDVKEVCRVLDVIKFSYGVARSTGSGNIYGYHLYIFFDGPIPAVKVRALSDWIFKKCGMWQEAATGKKPLPEFFPKQSFASFQGPGNAIKPPMIEPNWKRGRNGFIDEKDSFIPPEDQWKYLNAIPRVTADHFEKVLSDNQIIVPESASNPLAGSNKKKKIGYSEDSKWEQPITGSYEKVIEGCHALNRVFRRAAEGKTAGHHEGFDAFHLAMRCADGIEIFRERMTGWAENDRDLAQLEHSIRKDYNAPTCKTLQDHGVCVPGTKCFDKKPKLVMVEGQLVIDESVPEDKWPEPSPIRFAFGKGEDFLEKLKTEAADIKNSDEKDPNVLGNALRGLAKRAQVFDDDQQRALRDYMKSLRIIKASDLNKIFNQASNEHFEEIKEKASERGDCVVVSNNRYMLLDPCGYAIFKKINNKNTPVRFSDCIAEIHEERAYYDDDRLIETIYHGELKAEGFSTKFEINSSDWHDNSRFFQFMGNLSLSRFTILKADIEHFRQAATGFSLKRRIEKKNYLNTQGWYQGTYLMPDLLVDKDGIRPNTERIVDTHNKPHSQFLGFKTADNSKLCELLMHIKNDFLNTWPRRVTMTTLAHALMPCVTYHLGIKKKYTLFLEGLTGTGKTEILHAVQFLWGAFHALVNLASTGKGLMSMAHDFKDALLVFDDYKGLGYQQISAVCQVIQYSYDPNTAVKLTRESKLMSPKGNRGVLGMTGEMFPSNDAAMVARTLLIEMEKQDTTSTRDSYANVLKYREDYCCITPYFISYFLNLDHDEIKSELLEMTKNFYDRRRGEQNADRISYNLAVNSIIWKIFCHFMHDMGVVDSTERDELVREHTGHALSLQEDMMARCGEEQSGNVFLNTLTQMIIAKSVIVEGLNDVGQDTPINRPVIGFKSNAEDGSPLINLYPNITYNEVIKNNRHGEIRGTIRDFSRQFVEAGVMVAAKGRYQRYATLPNGGGRAYVWSLYAQKLGLSNGLYEVKGEPTLAEIECGLV